MIFTRINKIRLSGIMSRDNRFVRKAASLNILR